MPLKLPLVKNSIPFSAMVAMLNDPIGFLDKHRKEIGSVYRIQAPLKLAVVTNHEAVRHILQKNWRNYTKGTAYDGFRLMLGNGILTSSGKEWKNNRGFIQPSFSKENVRSLSNELNKTAIHWCENLVLTGPKDSFEAKEKLILYASDILANALIGKEAASHYKHLLFPIIEREYDFVLKRNLSIFNLPIQIPFQRHRQFKKSKSELDGFIDEIIRAKKAKSDDSIFSSVVSAHNKEGKGMSDGQLRDEFITLFTTGFETTASALTWTLLLLAKYPSYQEKLFQDIQSINQNDISSIMSGKWLNAIIKESMRMFAPAWVITRKSDKQDVINGFLLPEKTNLLISIHHIHRDPEFWDRPDDFYPERFIDVEKENPSFMPFGIGPRMCVGNHFSMTTISLFIFQFVKKYTFSLAVDRDLKIEAKIVSLPVGEVWLSPKIRN